MVNRTIRDNPWWNDPRRPCKDKAEYVDTTLVTGQGRSRVLKEMAASCQFCPVLVQCRTELLVIGGQLPTSQVRAGVVYR